MESIPRASRLATFGRAALTNLLVVACFYIVPIEPGVPEGQVVVRAIVTAVAGVLVTWLLIRQAAHQVADPEQASPASLLTALTGGVVFLALADFIIAISGENQFAGLETKTDALYFALTTLTTVGYGDVHAVGQVARAVVVVQLVFNVVVIATAASVLARSIRARARHRTASPPD